MREVRKERTGWRDEEISRRHRMWGTSCTATDIDFLLVETNRLTPVALIEYKNEFAPPQYIENYQYQVLKNLADFSNIVALAVRYKTDFSNFLVVPINNNALAYVPKRVELTEKGYVKLLYEMRGQEVPQKVLENIGVSI